jgi:DNA segregation ATPase FtsK/SpoIIIE, S-DNA-T family
LTAAQLREAGGVLIGGFGLLTLIAMIYGGGPVLEGLQQAIWGIFGIGWLLPLAAAVVLGALLIWPVRVLPRPMDLIAMLASALSLFGLLTVASRSSGGRVGQIISDPLARLLGAPATVLMLVVVMILGLIVAFHFSPGALLMQGLRGLQAAYAERKRVEQLVRRAGAPTRVSKRATVSHAVPAGARTEKVSEKASAEVAPEEPPAEDLSGWLPIWPDGAAPPPPLELDDHEPELPVAAAVPDADLAGRPVEGVEAPADEAEEDEDEPQPVLRVVAEPEDDEWDGIEWKLPPVSLLDNVAARRERLEEEIKRNVRVIESTLQTFGVQARVIGVNSGPAVTQYALQPAAGVAVKRVVALQNDLSLALAASPLRIEAPIPGRSAIGIEVPNKAAMVVSLREVVESPAFDSAGHALGVALGHDVTGQAIVGDLARMPHLLIAGATGQGKSVCINAMICSLLLRASPAELRLVMVDPKRVELNLYNGLPHLAVPVIVESHQAAAALRWAVAEMDRRYKLLSAEGVRNIKGYNTKAEAQNARQLPYVVVVIDELADLMMVAAGEVEELICRIAQLARAVGIHLLIATQRPSTDIITGLIKANIPSRIAFAVGSQVDSRVILDTAGAEKLLGRGDMLYQPIDSGKPTRIQGARVLEHEVEKLVRFWQQQADPAYMEDVLDAGSGPGDSEGGSQRKLDPLFARAARAVCAEGSASVSLIQRKFNVGYSRAGRIVDALAEHRVIGAYQGSKSREVLMTLPDVDELLERLGVER